MEHIEASLSIFFTSDYARFKMLNGNRQLNEKKIKRIMQEIRDGNDMLRYYPIQVRENGGRLDILDGQHRFYICKQMKRPVFYILVTEIKTMPEIAKINSNVEKWGSDDFVNCYVQFGNKNYEQLQAFMDTYGFSLGIALNMLGCGNPGGQHGDVSMNERFRGGLFEVKFYGEAIKIAEACRKFHEFTGWKSRAFVIAIYKVMEAGLYEIGDLEADFKKRREYLTKQENYKSYINILEQMANVGKHKRVIIA